MLPAHGVRTSGKELEVVDGPGAVIVYATLIAGTSARPGSNDSCSFQASFKRSSGSTTVLRAPTQVSPPNGASLDVYPRLTTLEWTSVAGAKSYGVDVQFLGGPAWSPYPPMTGLTAPEFTFEFIGAQPGRWRVWAIDENGRDGEKSGWWLFFYLR